MLRGEVGHLDIEAGGRDPLRALMGPSPQIDEVVRQIERVADSSLSILIQGETGTGKELVARAIHRLSARREGPFCALDCGAIPETLVETELFGHEKGAFTGAGQRTEGHFQVASGGTLFLDEFVNLPRSAQPKLLRALQERAVQPVGRKRPVAVDVRIVAASNVPLEPEVREGRFREDLYHRLSEYRITLPPLRERLGDVLYLADRFLSEARTELRRPARAISREAAEILLHREWRGNVRELRNAVRSAVLFGSEVIQAEDLSFLSSETGTASALGDPDGPQPGRSLKAIAGEAAADAERRAIRQALRTENGNKSAAARLLQADYKTLHVKMKRYGIAAGEFRTA